MGVNYDIIGGGLTAVKYCLLIGVTIMTMLVVFNTEKEYVPMPKSFDEFVTFLTIQEPIKLFAIMILVIFTYLAGRQDGSQKERWKKTDTLQGKNNK